eukprot:Sspe_Gene.21081::Locus_7837_Transcript_1_1_Confidence_1.000_Length_422::g.21081::m.21081
MLCPLPSTKKKKTKDWGWGDEYQPFSHFLLSYPHHSHHVPGVTYKAVKLLKYQRRPKPRKPEKTCPAEYPNKGIGWGIQAVAPFAPPPPKEPSHGRLPPYQRRIVTKCFNDDLSGGIACLRPPV